MPPQRGPTHGRPATAFLSAERTPCLTADRSALTLLLVDARQWLPVKMLRCDDIGLFTAADVDDLTGYRGYGADQLALLKGSWRSRRFDPTSTTFVE
jgi:hypothetical protein